MRNTGFFDDSSAKILIELMENYEGMIKSGQISPTEFDAQSTYRLLSEWGLNNNDYDRALELIKKRFHQDYINKQVRLDGLVAKYPTLSRETITNTEKLATKLEEKMNNGEKITQEILDEMLYETNNNSFAWEDMTNMLYENPKLKNWLNDCTHRDIYTNPDYVGYNSYYSKENIDEAVSWLDQILRRVEDGEKLTPELIKYYTDTMNYSFSDELLIDIIQKHWKLGPMYQEII